MIVSIFFFLFEISIMQSQKFRFLTIWFQETKPFKLIQEKKGFYKYTCDTELESCQELKIALEICSVLMVSYFFLCICSVLCLLFIDGLLILSFLFLQNFTLPKVLLAETLAQLYGIILSLGYITWWSCFSVFPSLDSLSCNV